MDQVDDSGGYWDIKYHNYCSVCPDSNSRVAKHKPTNCLGPRPFVLGVAKLATASAVGGACTVGPETSSKQKLGEMLDAGMSAVRLNASHGNYEFFEEAIRNTREAAELRSRICPIILDTKGPEVRVGPFDKPVTLNPGDPFIFYKNAIAENNGSKNVIFHPREGLQEMPPFPPELSSGDPLDSELWPRIVG